MPDIGLIGGIGWAFHGASDPVIAVEVFRRVPDQLPFVVVGVHLTAERELLQVVHASDLFAAGLGSGERRQKQRGQDRNDGDGEQQFDQRKRSRNSALVRSIANPRLLRFGIVCFASQAKFARSHLLGTACSACVWTHTRSAAVCVRQHALRPFNVQ